MVIFHNITELKEGKNKINIDKELLHYFKNVLRLQKKSRIIINSLNNTIKKYSYFIGELISFGSNYCEVNLIQKETVEKEFPLIDIFLVPLKSRYFQTAIEYITQMPINSINLIKSKFIATNFQEVTKKTKKIEKIIYWNTIYVKKHYIPTLKVVENLEEELKNYPKVVVFDHQIDKRISFESCYYDRIAIMIGPEGGWAKEEIEKFQALNNTSIYRFKNIDTAVKAELAAVIAITQILSYFYNNL